MVHGLTAAGFMYHRDKLSIRTPETGREAISERVDGAIAAMDGSSSKPLHFETFLK